MTIQLSVTVWTVICFILLMVILHHLLFKPVLKMMDHRHERVEKARKKKAEYEQMEQDFQAALEQEKVAALAAQKKELKRQVESLRAESKQAIEDAKAERVRELDRYHEEAEAERGRILGELSVYTEELALAFADSLTKE
ncbi:MAG: ATP synthase F0 subunit B [Clostridia bacterium]|nr:ATP synthase F0 subunit B [Clostridia bacterium]